MNYLLFFITSIFSFIFFIFYKLNNGYNIFSGNIIKQDFYFSSITGNLFIESIIFLVLSIFLFFYFSGFQFGKIEKKEKTTAITNNFNIDKKKYIKKIFSNYIYYIGFIFFYISIYLILYSFGIINFSYFILFLNLIITIIYILSYKMHIFKDFIKINTILFSLYYIFIYLYIFIYGENTLSIIDLVNTLFIFSFFIFTFYGDYKKEKNSIIKNNIKLKFDNSLILYFFIYNFIVFSFYFNFILINYFNFINLNFYIIFIYISVLLNVFIYFILQKIYFFQNSTFILRVLSFLFGYVAIIFSIIFFIKNINIDLPINFLYILNYFSIIGILIYLIIFNFKIHNLFQNYISLFFSLIGTIFLLNYTIFEYSNYVNGNKINLILVLNLSISFFIIIFTYLYSQRFKIDYFFLHIFAYIINILGVIYYLIFGNFEILNLGIILLLNSIFIFLSYFKLKLILNIK